jgi:hypothetical protein
LFCTCIHGEGRGHMPVQMDIWLDGWLRVVMWCSWGKEWWDSIRKAMVEVWKWFHRVVPAGLVYTGERRTYGRIPPVQKNVVGSKFLMVSSGLLLP